MSGSTPIVSVCLITYNHEAYIRQAIDSILMQKTNFAWELIIADDCSKDKTREIILEYQQHHPQLIKLLFQKKNVGGGRNFVDLLGQAKGKYTAYLEGDDYWCDPHKLQKQFDYLESHPDVSLCYHKIKWVYTYETTEDPNKESNVNDPEVSDMNDLLSRGWFMRSCSLFYRTISLPKGFERLYVGDYPLHVLLADKGKIGFVNECMAVYRINNNGFSETNLINVDVKKVKQNFRSELSVMKYLDYHTGFRYHLLFRMRILGTVYSHLHSLRQYGTWEVVSEFWSSIWLVGPINLMRAIFTKLKFKNPKLETPVV